MKIVMLGAPGAGKGTQAIKIAEKYGLPHISTGDIFRYNIKNNTELGLKAKEYMDNGQLVPDELTVSILLDRVAKDDCSKGYILDGYPRTIPQAEVLEEALKKLGENIDYAVNVVVSDENIIERMSGRRTCPNCGETYHIIYNNTNAEGICDKCSGDLIQRPDDMPETVKKRLEVYHAQTKPLEEFYQSRNVYKEVDGTKAMNEVFEDICKILG